MKKSLVLLLFFVLPLISFSQKSSSNDEQEVQQLIIDCFDSIWSDMDSTKLTQYHTDDYLLLEHGEVWNNDTIRNYMRRALASKNKSKRENRFEFIKTERYGNSIWIAYENWATWSHNDEITGSAHWLESAVAVKTEAGWKIKMLHSTRIEREKSSE